MLVGCLVHFHLRFNFFIKKIEQLGGPNDGSYVEIPETIEYMVLKTAYNILNIIPEKDSSNNICYAGAANSYVVRSNGRLAKCTVVLDDERNDIGRITESGEIELSTVRAKAWINSSLNGDAASALCPLSGLS